MSVISVFLPLLLLFFTAKCQEQCFDEARECFEKLLNVAKPSCEVFSSGFQSINEYFRRNAEYIFPSHSEPHILLDLKKWDKYMTAIRREVFHPKKFYLTESRVAENGEEFILNNVKKDNNTSAVSATVWAALTYPIPWIISAEIVRSNDSQYHCISVLPNSDKILAEIPSTINLLKVKAMSEFINDEAFREFREKISKLLKKIAQQDQVLVHVNLVNSALDTNHINSILHAIREREETLTVENAITCALLSKGTLELLDFIANADFKWIQALLFIQFNSIKTKYANRNLEMIQIEEDVANLLSNGRLTNKNYGRKIEHSLAIIIPAFALNAFLKELPSEWEFIDRNADMFLNLKSDIEHQFLLLQNDFSDTADEWLQLFNDIDSAWIDIGVPLSILDENATIAHLSKIPYPPLSFFEFIKKTMKDNDPSATASQKFFWTLKTLKIFIDYYQLNDDNDLFLSSLRTTFYDMTFAHKPGTNRVQLSWALLKALYASADNTSSLPKTALYGGYGAMMSKLILRYALSSDSSRALLEGPLKTSFACYEQYWKANCPFSNEATCKNHSMLIDFIAEVEGIRGTWTHMKAQEKRGSFTLEPKAGAIFFVTYGIINELLGKSPDEKIITNLAVQQSAVFRQEFACTESKICACSILFS